MQSPRQPHRQRGPYKLSSHRRVVHARSHRRQTFEFNPDLPHLIIFAKHIAVL